MTPSTAIETIEQQSISKNSMLWTMLKQHLWSERRVWITSSTVATCIVFLHLTGLLQFWELGTLDQFYRLHPLQLKDDRIVIVEIDEENLQKVGKWPMPDRVLAQILTQVQSQQPRVIGLDIYRDLPVEPGSAELKKAFRSIPNLIGIEKIQDKNSSGVQPPAILRQQNQVGFNNVVLDADGKVRRSLLYWWVGKKAHISFPLKLAFVYLQAEGIQPQAAKNNNYLQLGKGVFRRFKMNDGAYVRADDKGYQILGNFLKAGSFLTVPMEDLLSNNLPSDLMHDRIVLIGSTATSLNDFFYTPQSGDLIKSARSIPGVEVQANFLSQILFAAKSGGGLFRVWPDPIEWLWIFLWSYLGAILVWRSPSILRSLQIILLVGIAPIAAAYLAFLMNWWLPVVSPLLALVSSAMTITIYIAHLREEFKRSKEFLQNIINAIPDPVFVKDKKHQWIVLNEAFCEFLGYPLYELLEKTDYDFFSSDEADTFWYQDELVFSIGKPAENEERFTDAKGITHLIATKRSLHKDSAGNLFLVGVIRDITQRKKLEEQLIRTANELARSNSELRLSEDRLRYLAYHDNLTGLANRKLFYECLSESLERAHYNGQMLALLFLDLDGFKQINDTEGHDMGDLLLQAVADRLTQCLRSNDTVSRLGGDEFTVILPTIRCADDVEKVAQKILFTITQPFGLKEKTLSITISIGVSIFPLHADDMDKLIQKADMAMYRAKQLGKNKYEIF